MYTENNPMLRNANMNTYPKANRISKWPLMLVIALFSLGACSDVLVEETKQLAVENFYNTEAELESALNAIYTPLYGDLSMGAQYQVLQDALSDFFIPNGSWIPLGSYTTLDNTNYGRTGYFWNQFYLAIRNANLVIANAPTSTMVEDSRKSEIVASARFMRALLYFQLVRGWGSIPLRTDENLAEINLPKSSIDDVYQLIVNDLAYAEANLGGTVRLSGRPTHWAAKTVLADVYLCLERYDDARAKARDVIDNGPFSLVRVTAPDDFLQLYGPDVDNSSEEIFYLKFTRQSGFANALTLYEAHPNTPYANRAGFFSLYSRLSVNRVVRDWDDDDLRKQFNLYPWAFGSGDDTYLVRKFQDLNALGGRGGNDYPWYKFSDLLLIYAEAENGANGGPTAAAVEALNQIRRRAYGQPATTPWAGDYRLTDYTSATFLDLVLKERGYETMFEGKRWRDLVRLGKASEYIKASKGVNEIASLLYLWPIPTSEMNYNTELDPVKDQNPGY